MGLNGRRAILIGLVLGMILGFSVYFKLWVIDSNFSFADTQNFMRRQLDFSNMQAMDESEEWRLKYDEEVERATNCLEELIDIKIASEKKLDEADSSSINEKLAVLKKENIGLLDQIESLTQELLNLKLNCSLHRHR